MSGNKKRIAMVGAGARAMQVIYPAMAAQPDVEIVGICEIDEMKCIAAAEQYKIPNRYGTKGVYEYRDMLTELNPDAVAIIGSPHIIYGTKPLRGS